MPKKKNLMVLSLIAAIIFIAIRPVSADTSSGVRVMVNNQQLVFSTYPTYSGTTLMAPAKEFIQALGGTFSYDNSTMAGKIVQGENELIFRLDNSIAKFNGKNVQAPAPMKIISNRFMLPAQFTAERLGAEVYMNTTKNTMMVFQAVNGKIIYQVASGDTLWIISKLFNTTVTSIKMLNSLTTDIIYVGQKLIVKNSTPLNSSFSAITSGSATIRSGPGSSYSAVNYLYANTQVSITGKVDNWYKVVTPKGNGYIYYSVLSIGQDVADTAPNSTFFNNSIPYDASGDSLSYSSYTVQKGDTIWSVAQKFGIPQNELASANSLSLSTYLSIGQIIKIPVHTIAVKQVLNPKYGEILDWFTEAQYVFPIGKVAKFVDLQTGKSFIAERTIGASHSDTETLTAQDAQTMKEIFGGAWTWNKRPFILEVDGRRFAVSVAGMPHAGVDGVPFLQNVGNRSDSWGYGPNYDSISGNGMDGHFDVYFLNCLRHNDNKIDSYHQFAVATAGGLE